MIYVLMILLILAICALIFVITLNKTGWDGHNPGESESREISVSDSGSSDSSSSDDQSSDISESSGSDSSDVSSDSSDNSDSSGESSSSETSSSSSDQTSSGSGSAVTLPTNFDVEFFSDDLFIGDSIFTGLYLYGYLDQANVAAAVGYTPYKAMHSSFGTAYSGSATDYAAERKPKRIIIMLGSNTMGAGTDFDVIVTHYETMLTSLKQNCPDSKICVISIPPVTADSSLAASSKINNADINTVNAKLKKMAGEAEVDYFDLNSMLRDDDGYFIEDYAEVDGLHFKGVTYKVLLSALQTKYDI